MKDNLQSVAIGLAIILIAVIIFTFYYAAFLVMFIILAFTAGKAIIIMKKEINKID